MSKRVKVSEMKAGYEYILDGKDWKEGNSSSIGERVLCMDNRSGHPWCSPDFRISYGIWSKPAGHIGEIFYSECNYECTQLYDYPTYQKLRKPGCCPSWYYIPNPERSITNPNYTPIEAEIKQMKREQDAVPWTPGNVKALIAICVLILLGLMVIPLLPFTGGVSALLGLYIWSDRWDRRQCKRNGG